VDSPTCKGGLGLELPPASDGVQQGKPTILAKNPASRETGRVRVLTSRQATGERA